MKARLVRQENVYKLLFCTGDVSSVKLADIKKFFSTFNDEKYYTGETWDHEEVTIETFAGETVAIVDDNLHLIIYDPCFLMELLMYRDITNYVTIDEYAEKHGKKSRIIRRYCIEGRIEDAVQKGRGWLVPSDAIYPDDTRVGKRAGTTK